MSEAYKAAGVDLALSDDASKMLYEAAQHTWANREGQYGEILANQDFFRGARVYGIKYLLEAPQPEGFVFDDDSDGIGTKVRIAQAMGKHDTIARDLIAMACDDPAAKGFEPSILTSVLDVNMLTERHTESMRQLATGYVTANNIAKTAVKGGELAVLGKSVGGYGKPHKVLQYNWSATVHSAGHETRILDGSKVEPGDALVVLEEQGFRSNGFSFVRSALEKAFGKKWHEVEHNGTTLGDIALRPSIIYTPGLVELMGGYNLRRDARANIHAVAHISGGGIPGKLGDMLSVNGLGAQLDNLYDPGEGTQIVQKASGISDEELHHIVNMGQGMIIATPDPDKTIAVLAEQGINSQVGGEVTDTGVIDITSRGQASNGKKISYPVVT